MEALWYSVVFDPVTNKPKPFNKSNKNSQYIVNLNTYVM